MDATEHALLTATVRDALAAAPANADTVLDDLGWRDMLAAEPNAAIEIVFGALGATNATASALDDVLVSGLGLDPSADLAVLLPPFGSWNPPGTTGLTTSRITTAAQIRVISPNTGALPDHQIGGLVTHQGSADVRAVRGVDPEGGLYAVTVSAVEGTAVDVGGWDDAVALGQRALAQQMAGASRTMLELACAHARERVQFGRPIAGFQAVRHRLADALVAVEALDAALGAAADEPNPMTAALAKAVAGRTASTVATHCQQVLAGIGFTTDHPFHRFLKRTMVLDGILGSADDIVLDIGRGLLSARTVPTLIEL